MCRADPVDLHEPLLSMGAGEVPIDLQDLGSSLQVGFFLLYLWDIRMLWNY